MPSELIVARVPFHVVFVCTGNRVRSPIAEAFLRSKTGGEAVLVESYGTLELGPEPATPEAIGAASTLGLDIRGHRARSLQGVRLDDADLVVGFEPIHVATAVVEAAASKERAFTIRELTALLEDLGSAASRSRPGPEAAIALAHARRPTGHQSSLSVADPYGKSRRVYEKVASTIDALTSTLATRLFERSAYERQTG